MANRHIQVCHQLFRYIVYSIFPILFWQILMNVVPAVAFTMGAKWSVITTLEAIPAVVTKDITSRQTEEIALVNRLRNLCNEIHDGLVSGWFMGLAYFNAAFPEPLAWQI